MGEALSAALGGALVAVAACGAFAWVYNRYLTKVHESVVKKVTSLALLPAGALLGAAWGARLAMVDVAGTEAALFVVIAAIGALVTMRQVGANVVRARRVAREATLERVPFPGDPINWRALKWWARAMLRVLKPVNGVGDLRVARIEVPMPGLGAGLDGLRVVHVTDAHVHKTLRRAWWRHVARVAMEQRPDVLLFGGDFLSKPAHARDIAWLASLMTAPMGTFLVRGNHDFWKAPRRAVRLAGEHGWRVLSNAGTEIERGGARLALVGIEAPWLAPTLADRVAMRRLSSPRLGMVHTPDAYGEAARAGCAMAISGHTHGGQMRLPLFGTVISGCGAGPGLADQAGRLGALRTWTSRGVGAYLPLRFLCPPEVLVLTLRATPSPEGPPP